MGETFYITKGGKKLKGTVMNQEDVHTFNEAAYNWGNKHKKNIKYTHNVLSKE